MEPALKIGESRKNILDTINNDPLKKCYALNKGYYFYDAISNESKENNLEKSRPYWGYYLEQYKFVIKCIPIPKGKKFDDLYHQLGQDESEKVIERFKDYLTRGKHE